MHAQCIWKCIFRCTCVYLGCAHACTTIRYTNMCVCIPFTCMHMEMHIRICIFMGKCVHHAHVYVHMRVHPYCTRTHTCIHLYGTRIHAHAYEYVTNACIWTQHRKRRDRRLVFPPPLLSSLSSSSPLLLQEGCTLSHRLYFPRRERSLPLKGRGERRRRGKRGERRGGEGTNE
jgi:hypothetical protein